jgi:disulfide bond formation protein DsbB
MSILFAVLAIACLLFVAATLAVAMVGPKDMRSLLRARIEPVALPAAFAVATVAMLGSLYYSEIAGFTPCELCWYQRIAMYPLSPVLGIAAWRRDVQIRLYTLPLAGVGAMVAAYHALLQRFPSLSGDACDPSNPCTGIWVQEFGFVTIPVMALSGFLAIIVLLSLIRSPVSRPTEISAHADS